MRICSPQCGIAPETTSGGETYERELLTRLGRDGIEIDLILAKGKPYPPNIPNWTVHRFPIRKGLRWPVAPLIVPQAIKRVYDRRPFDLLRVHALRHMGPSVLWARRRYGLDVPIVAHHHHLDASPWNRLIDKRVIEAADHVITVSEFSKRQLETELGVRTDHVSVIHDGVDERFVPGQRDEVLARSLGIGPGPVALTLGGLKPRKNLEGLIELWWEVHQHIPTATLVIAGDGPLRDRLRFVVKALALEGSVVFTGRVHEMNKVAIYQLADVFVSTSWMEGFGLTVAEAMSCGLPVVVSTRGALPEVVGSSTGATLCDPDHPQGFVQALIGRLTYPERSRGDGRANRTRIESRFRWDRTAQAVRWVYEEAVARWQKDKAA